MATNHVPLKFAMDLTALREHRQGHTLIVAAGDRIDAEALARCKKPEDFIVVVRPQVDLDATIQKNIKDQERAEANRLSTMSQTIPASTLLFSEGETSDDIYILLKGGVEIIKSDEVVARINEPGAFIGEMAVLTKQPRSATVRTTDESSFYTFKGDALLEQAKKQPVVLAKMCKSLAQKLSDLDYELSQLHTKETTLHRETHTKSKLILPSEGDSKRTHSQTNVPANTILFTQGDTSLEMYILLKGSISIIVDEQEVASIDTPGTLLGEMSGLLAQPRSATISTVAESVFCIVPPGDLLTFGTKHPGILMKMCLNLAHRLNTTTHEFLKLRSTER